MIATVMRIGWLNLVRDRVALAMTFVLPVAFFSIFQVVFGSQGGRGEVRPLRVALVDQDGSEASQAFAAALQQEKALRLVTTARARRASAKAPSATLDRARAQELVRDGELSVAVVLLTGFGEGLARFDAPARAELLVDPSNPIAGPLMQGMLQKAAATAQPDGLARRGLEQFEKYAGALTPGQRQVVDAWLAQPKSDSASQSPIAEGLVSVAVTEVVGGGPNAPLIAFFAAGTGVMFLLFSCAAAGGSLLEEVESGTLERLLTSPLGMGRLLVGKWLLVTLLGVMQMTVMFVWGALVFGLELVPHLAGFALVTLATAGAASAFGLVLASACRSRGQLSGISTIVILMMSAVGGSMFPRFLMSESMQRLGLLTFNGWALDGYLKVFWRKAPLVELWPQLLVLSLLAAAFLAAARLLARRWETA
ncbi:MAG TPA: ABC transporter permease [Vicinamibacteria bacterium]